MKQKQKKTQRRRKIIDELEGRPNVEILWSDGVPWTCGCGTLTSFSDDVKNCDREEEEGTLSENIGSCVQSRSFEIADSNITNIFIRTSLEYFNARCPLSIFSLNRAVTSRVLNEDLQVPRLAGKLL